MSGNRLGIALGALLLLVLLGRSIWYPTEFRIEPPRGPAAAPDDATASPGQVEPLRPAPLGTGSDHGQRERIERRSEPTSEPESQHPREFVQLRGRVVDEEEGTRLEDVRVRTWPIDDSPIPLTDRKPTGDARSDAFGKVDVPAVAGGKSWVVATAEGYRTWIGAVSPGEELYVDLVPGGPARYLVADTDESPIEGVRITVLHEEVVLSRHRTDARGLAPVAAPADGWLRFEAPGHAVALIRPAEGDGSYVVLPAAQPLGGVVVDENGEPLAGVEVTHTGSHQMPGTATRTDDDGRFLFQGAPGGRSVWVRVEIEGRLFTQVQAAVGRRDVRVVVQPATSIRGIVLKPDLTPAAGAQVGPGGHEVGKDGRFALTGVPLDTAVVTARWGNLSDVPGFERALTARYGVRHELRPGRDPDAEIRLVLVELPRSYRRIRLLDETGKPLVGLSVRGSPGAAGANTDATGTAEVGFAAAPGADGRLGVDPPATQFIGVRLELTTRASPGGEPVVFRVPGSPRLAVTVVHPESASADPPTDLHVWLRLDDPGAYPPQVSSTGWETTFRVPPGSSGVVFARAPGVGAAVANWSAPAEGTRQVSVRLEPWSSIRLVLDGDAALTRDSELYVSAAEQPNDGNWRSDARLRPRGGGTWASDAVHPGTNYIQVRRNHALLLEQRISVAPGETWNGTIQLPPVRTIEGIVHGAGGEPLGGCEVILRTGRGSPSPDAITGPDGRFSVTVAAAEGMFLTIEREQYGGFARAVAEIPDGPVEVELSLEGTVRVIYTPPDGPHGRGARFRLPDTALELRPRTRPVPASETPAGRSAVDFLRLPVGRVEVSLTFGPEQRWHPVVVVSGKVVEVDIGQGTRR